MNPDLIYLFIGETVIILALYKWIFRQMIVSHWEKKIAEDGWLIINLEPVIDEIEDRMHEKLEQFQASFFGSVGAMTKKAKDLDPMNNIRKAAKDGDWASMLVEYAANKSGIGGVLSNFSPKEGENEAEINSKPLIPKKLFK